MLQPVTVKEEEAEIHFRATKCLQKANEMLSKEKLVLFHEKCVHYNENEAKGWFE